MYIIIIYTIYNYILTVLLLHGDETYEPPLYPNHFGFFSDSHGRIYGFRFKLELEVRHRSVADLQMWTSLLYFKNTQSNPGPLLHNHRCYFLWP